MNRPFGEFIGKLVDGGCGNTSLMSPENWKKWKNEEIGEHPVGSGPFKFVERVRGEKIVLERYDDYWGATLNDPRYQAPYVDRLIFRPMPDAAARVAALETGEVDIIWSPPPDSIQPLLDKGFKVSQGPSPHVIYFNLNMREPCMQDMKARQALNYAIDREGIARELLKGTALPAHGMIVPGSPAFDPNYKPYPYDTAKAKQLLAESSCAQNPEITLLVPTGGSGNIIPVPIAEWIQRNLNEAGFKCELETYEWQTYLSFWWKGIQENQTGYWMSWGMTTPFWVEVFAHSKWFAPDGSNIGWYKNPEVDALLDQALAETDEKKRYELYTKAHDLVMQDASMIAVVHDSTPVLMAPYVKGYVHAPQNWMDFRTIWLDQ
jgi:peptide/nickel transport system substrate-binding protein